MKAKICTMSLEGVSLYLVTPMSVSCCAFQESAQFTNRTKTVSKPGGLSSPTSGSRPQSFYFGFVLPLVLPLSDQLTSYYLHPRPRQLV